MEPYIKENIYIYLPLSWIESDKKAIGVYTHYYLLS